MAVLDYMGGVYYYNRKNGGGGGVPLLSCSMFIGQKRQRSQLQRLQKIVVFFTFLLYIEPCAADFSLLNLPKGKSLGRSKPATNS
jgi:hypothetical protein